MGQRIVIVSGPGAGQVINFEKALTIGRSSENEVVLDDRQVSRKHASVETTASGVLLKDLGSGNGIFVEGRRVLEFRLSDGASFNIGDALLRYEGKPDAAAMSPAGSSTVRFSEDAAGAAKSASADDLFKTLFAAPDQGTDKGKLEATQNRLAAIYKANQIIASERDLKRLFARVVDELFALVPANNGVILLADPDTGGLSTAFERRGGKESAISVSMSIVKKAHESGQAVILSDAKSEFDAAASIATGNITSVMCAPLRHQDEKLGVIYVDTRGSTNAFADHDLELLVALAGPAATAIRNAQYVQELEEEFRTSLILLARAIELRDHYTVGHTWRVTNFSVTLARELGWDEEKLKIVEMGGVLHDVGKIGVPDAVLQKPGKLDEEEFAKMRVHPERGAELMRDSKKLQQLIPYCLYHHERYDGKGYPKGLKGEEIPIEGRIVAVADTFDAMTSNRPYRKGLDPEIAIAELIKCKGTQFDPECADAFVRAFRAGKINHVLQVYHEQDEKSFACPFCSTYIQVPEAAKVDDIFKCRVCHRSVRLEQIDNAYHGALVAEIDVAAE